MARKQTSETETIHADWWDADETVVLRKYLSHGAQKAMQQAFASSVDRDSIKADDMENIKVDPVKAIELADTPLLYWIVSWTLKDTTGALLPLGQASLDSLHEDDINYINAEIAKRSQGMTEAQQESFLPTPSAGTGD